MVLQVMVTEAKAVLHNQDRKILDTWSHSQLPGNWRAGSKLGVQDEDLDDGVSVENGGEDTMDARDGAEHEGGQEERSLEMESLQTPFCLKQIHPSLLIPGQD